MSSSVPNLGTLGAGSSSNRRAYIKDPGLDPVIKMARDRRIRELHLGKQKRAVSGISGGTLHKQLELNTITKEILQLEEGVKEYQDQINLLEERKRDIRKGQVEDREWCATFDRVIGPFQAKYDKCQEDVVSLAKHGMEVYQKSFQKLIDEFGFHPAFKRWFDDF